MGGNGAGGGSKSPLHRPQGGQKRSQGKPTWARAEIRRRRRQGPICSQGCWGSTFDHQPAEGHFLDWPLGRPSHLRFPLPLSLPCSLPLSLSRPLGGIFTLGSPYLSPSCGRQEAAGRERGEWSRSLKQQHEATLPCGRHEPARRDRVGRPCHLITLAA